MWKIEQAVKLLRADADFKYETSKNVRWGIRRTKSLIEGADKCPHPRTSKEVSEESLAVKPIFVIQIILLTPAI